MISFRFTWWQVIIWIYKSTNSRTVNDFHLCECFANINCECDWKYCSGPLSSVHCFWMKKSVKGKFTTVKSLVVVTGYGSFCCTDHQSELPSQYTASVWLTFLCRDWLSWGISYAVAQPERWITRLLSSHESLDKNPSLWVIVMS